MEIKLVWMRYRKAFPPLRCPCLQALARLRQSNEVSQDDIQEALRLHELSKESLSISHNGSIYGNETEKVDEISQVNALELASWKNCLYFLVEPSSWTADLSYLFSGKLCRFTLS